MFFIVSADFCIKATKIDELPTIIKLAWKNYLYVDFGINSTSQKNLPWTNWLAYFTQTSVTEKKSFMTVTKGANVIEFIYTND